MKEIILYHGTTADFSLIDLRHCKDKKDFGKGFYTTTDINQAKALALRMRENSYIRGIPKKAYVYMFKVNKDLLKNLKVHTFRDASIAWIDYIITNRCTEFRNMDDYDVVIGKVADINASAAINKFVNTYSVNAPDKLKMQLAKILKPDNLSDQYCFKTDKAIAILNNTRNQSNCFMRKEF